MQYFVRLKSFARAELIVCSNETYLRHPGRKRRGLVGVRLPPPDVHVVQAQVAVEERPGGSPEPLEQTGGGVGKLA